MRGSTTSALPRLHDVLRGPIICALVCCRHFADLAPILAGRLLSLFPSLGPDYLSLADLNPTDQTLAQLIPAHVHQSPPDSFTWLYCEGLFGAQRPRIPPHPDTRVRPFPPPASFAPPQRAVQGCQWPVFGCGRGLGSRGTSPLTRHLHTTYNLTAHYTNAIYTTL